MHAELEELFDRLSLRAGRNGQQVFTATRGTVELAVGISGIGAGRTTGLLREMCDRFRPDLVISAGFAGGLDPTFEAGRVVEPRWVIHESQRLFELSGDVPTLVEEQVDRDPQRTLVTVDALADTRDRKRHLHATYRAAIADMETSHLAALARQRGLRLIAVRAVSDPADTALPRQALTWIDPQGRTRAGAIASALLRQPSLVPEMMRLGRMSRLAGHNLADVLERKVDAL